MASPGTLHHVTLNTGHTRPSPRSEVSVEVIASLQDGITGAIKGQSVSVPNCPGYRMTGAASGACLLATLWQGDLPLVTVGIAAEPGSGSDLWRMLHDKQPGLVTAHQFCPPVPWVAARIEAGLTLDIDAAGWVGDWERCLGWAWLSRMSKAARDYFPIDSCR